MEERKQKSVSESKTEQTHTVRPVSINGYGRLFGGQLMQWIDETAGFVSTRHCGLITTTAEVDSLNFKAPAYTNDMVVLVGRLTYVGRTSMEVRVDTYVEALDGTRRNINSAYIVMVAIDDNGKAIEVPGLKIETMEEQAEWEAGKKRYELRKKRRKEGY